jgi:hypothetical protein
MWIAQVAQAVEPQAWREPPAKLRLRGSVEPLSSRRNATGQSAILEGFDVQRHAASLATIARDV